jgi:hypothetical protein
MASFGQIRCPAMDSIGPMNPAENRKLVSAGRSIRSRWVGWLDGRAGPAWVRIVWWRLGTALRRVPAQTSYAATPGPGPSQRHAGAARHVVLEFSGQPPGGLCPRSQRIMRHACHPGVVR